MRNRADDLPSPLRPALLLDRDGVIISNREYYVRTQDQVEVFDQALEALARAAQSDSLVVIVTNQSAVGRGVISLEMAQEINQHVVNLIEGAGGRVDGVYMCPHAPQANCPCRKPQPGLILQAAQELRLDLRRSIMLGDALTDIQAGQAAGVGRTALIKTGRGRSQTLLPQADDLFEFETYETLLEAVTAWLA